MASKPTLIVPPSGSMRAHCFRLKPGDNLMPSLKQAASIVLARAAPLEKSAFVVTAVGSLRDATLRLANASRTDTTVQQEKAINPKGDSNDDDKNDIKRWAGQRFEIVSLTGTFSRKDGCHLHISLADAAGNVVGGHLIDGIVFTTVEVVIGTADGIEFTREMDDDTGYGELVARQLRSRTESLRRMWADGVVPASFFCVAIGFIAGMSMKKR